MKAAICYEFGQPLVIENVELSPPHAGEVQVNLTACAICHSDILYMDGGWGGTLPAIYGHEAAGIIEKTGPGVTLVEIGEPVVVSLIRSCGRCYFCAQAQPYLCPATFPLDYENRIHTKTGRPLHQGLRTAAFAEKVVVHESQLVKVSPDMPLDRASLLACGVITGLGAVTNTAHVPAGSSVVVIGAGGVGLNSIQGAALCGAQPIIAVDLVDGKLSAAKTFGATHTINPAKEDVLETVKLLTQGRGTDYVFETAGSARAMELGATLLKRGGALVLVGMPASGVQMQFEAANFVHNNQHILSSKMGAARPQVDIPKLAALYQQGRIKLDELITARYPLEQINEAVSAVKRGDALRNVIVF